LGGDRGRDVAINDVDVFTTITFPSFLHSRQFLKVTPGFSFHFWDGPQVAPPTSDLPSKAYSAYVDFGWDPQVTERLGGDIHATVGIYSDLQSFNTNSIRVHGMGLGVIRLTPTFAVKLGVAYLDRADLKLLPAGGILWTPNEKTRFDILFPKPKLAQYLTDCGNTSIWWYVGGEYGGGSWTVERLVLPPSPIQPIVSDRIDINDLRVFGGLEWTHPNSVKGFVEAGYVFDREVIYVGNQTLNFSPRDTFMLRAGVSF